jgi:hypothetical protein
MRTIVLTLLTTVCLSAAPGVLGSWQLSSQDGDGNTIRTEITFRDEAGALKATLKTPNRSIEIDRVKLDGDKAIFEIQWEDNFVAVELTAEGDKIKGLWRSGEDSGPISGTRANLWAGLWKLTASRPNGGATRLELDIKADGKYELRTANGEVIPVEQFMANPSDLSFQINAPQGTFKVVLKLEGDGAKGTWTSPEAGSGTIDAVR